MTVWEPLHDPLTEEMRTLYGELCFWLEHFGTGAREAEKSTIMDRLKQLGFNQWGLVICPVGKISYQALCQEHGITPEF